MGRREGGLKIAAMKKQADPDFYKRIGAIGGSRKVPKDFALMDSDKRRAAGSKGGSISRRGPVPVTEPESEHVHLRWHFWKRTKEEFDHD